MKKSMQELLSKNKEKISKESAEKILRIDEAEIAEFLREIGSQEIEYIPSGMIKKGLTTEYIGKKIYSFNEVESTNSVAKFLAKQGSPEGTVIISETQTKGKGRRGKKWESPSGGIWLSIILKPDIDPSKAPLITLATGVAVARTLRGMNIDARIKWPNDILINNKKVCGILTEANAKFNTVEYVIVGVGIDTNLNVDVLTEDVKKRATSLSVEAKIEISESETVSNFLNEFEEIYDLFKLEQFDEILYDWRKMSQTIGSYVEIKQPLGKVLKGTAVGINNQGALILELNNGELKKVISGECTLKEN
ncbi:biotin--[acetyl-CoA-carboxylase] ligase [Methanobrevibacter arboriphilus]|jgi:BirA family biotin operon repressor/biotin-[acetyl-CoA-carboxylase] ligase|uniref:Biotin--[acetyl-CoA-carboxylase] ligase n=1 Tax=Methanobrevibacter arboriphilus TaxID=39441 RepID=A0ACA8R2U9_METAZ|nr:biotin--[acetyl-CoA-carboxylase] ligase [Methanobrevibacter arboriphilus]BBL61636.1 biotin--[acetyl-CoA-carboxylase] ligase [Methanobrevibacter arboriphilus]GLI12492.1 biotin--[acetyl-CoA-carboxylase] ligase [Methanobrevibacter arboriphilus]